MNFGDNMSLIAEVKSIEYPSVRNLNWYYHSFYFVEDNFRDMLQDGIKCCELLSRKSGGNNGKHYISLIKDLGVAKENYGFNSFMKSSTSFIIDDIKPLKCSTSMWWLYHLFSSIKIPLRGSGWKDEFQEYMKIDSSKFVGLQCPLYNWVVEALDERYISDFTIDFKNLKNIIEILKEYGHVLPIYDYSRRNGEKVHLIDQDRYLDKCDCMLEEVKSLTKRRLDNSSSNATKIVV